jgi:UDPglucose 6-dehydrogenase
VTSGLLALESGLPAGTTFPYLLVLFAIQDGVRIVNVAVVGTGYVGLVTGTCLAETGNHVICMDINPEIVKKLNNGEIHIYEPGLAELVKKNHAAGRLNFTGDLATAAKSAKVIFVAVPTPELPSGHVGMQYVNKVVDDVAALFHDKPTANPILILKSTVPPGTNRIVADRFIANGCAHVAVASNPEFLKEGAAIDDFMKPDRVVVGVRDEAVAEVLRELYRPYCTTERPFIVMSPESAEMTKYAANVMLATKISFINEIANLCDSTGADVNCVREGIGFDQRIGTQFLAPGAGYGGSCFPKDVKGLIAVARRLGLTMRVAEAVDAANDVQKEVLFNKINKHFDEMLAGKTIAVWGLAFKPKTDDIREAPALTLIDGLLASGAKVNVFDPEAMKNVKRQYKDTLHYTNDPLAALDGADALVLVTEWPEFRNPDFTEIKRRLKWPTIFDGRNLFSPHEATIRELGFRYYGIGRGE